MFIKSPQTAAEWEEYFHLRWEVLRSPWGKPLGSEQDEIEFSKGTFHAMIIESDGEVIGVGRLHLIPTNIAQVRYMAVKEGYQGKGIGTNLIKNLEETARVNKVSSIVLQARENAVKFYEKHGFHKKEKSFLLYEKIQHYLMEKNL